jgi:hypothetical protein
MTAQHPLFDAIDELAESVRYLTTDEAKERFDAELDRCIQELQEFKKNQPTEERLSRPSGLFDVIVQRALLNLPPPERE